MEEIWKDIPGYEGFYKISNTEKIKSIDRVICSFDPRWGKYKNTRYYGRELKFITDRDGYYQVSLCKNGSQKEKKVHRLIAECFLDTVDGKTQVNHKNGIKTDNRVENLEWCTAEENNIHAKENNLLNPNKGDNHWTRRIGWKNKQISRIVLNVQTGIFYDNIREAANAHGFNYSTLAKKLEGRRINRTPLIFA